MPTSCFGSFTTAVVLGVIYSIANKFQPLPEDVFRSGISLFGLILSPTSCTTSFLMTIHLIKSAAKS
jgi:biotin transporter BioY